jgi:DNA gyrase subunit B
LLNRGHIFIAQPPLYKVARGKSEQYLKNERALEDYLTEGGLDDCSLTLENGEVRRGADLRAIADEARQIRNLVTSLHHRYNFKVVEQAATLGMLSAAMLQDPEAADIAAKNLALKMDLIADEFEKGWEGAYDNGTYMLSRMVRGVKEVSRIDGALVNSLEAAKLNEYAGSLTEIYKKPAILKRKTKEFVITGPLALFDAVKDAGAEGIKLQRYKGLGEMNAEQLWETTLDKNVRTLLQVKVGEGDEADDIFSRLMGDLVEPRREFIQENALSARLDA